ncbi:unnamed protein product [Effrenium voratum]|uniref:Uncharacterized protein n=1 Tax=Effrenium voratum TaxID=2562239 RepID=A0AA36MW20_9DINO|nr:unnamed protein product [Effrenium voratum]
MVTISQKVVLQYRDERAVTIPNDYILVGPTNGKSYLRVKATCQSIIQLMTGGRVARTSSIHASSSLRELVQARNHQLDHVRDPDAPDDGEQAQLFDDGPANPSTPPKKRKASRIAMPEMVTIQVGSTPVEVLIHGRRPRSTDLAVELEATQLEAVIIHLREDSAQVVQEVEAILASKQGVNNKVEAVLQLLRAHGLAHDQEEKRGAQLAANQELVSNSNGFLTLSASHTIAFLRCLQYGIEGPEGTHAIVQKDKDPHAGEEAMPHLPSFIELAMNSTNAIMKQANELEVALQLATAFDQGLTMQQAIGKVSQASTSCQRSIPSIAMFVQKFGGGSPGFPFLHFLNGFSKSFNASLQIGTETMQLLSTLDFRVATQIYPMIRISLWATMLTSPKSQDGFAKILTQSDIQRLKTSQMLPAVQQAEAMLQDAWRVQQQMKAMKARPEAVLQKAFGRMAAKKPEPASSQGVTSVLDASPKAIALLQNNHMELGNMYTNSADHGPKVFVLESMDDSHATMRHQPIFQADESVQVPLEHLRKWRPAKVAQTKVCPPELAKACLPSMHAMIQDELQKSKVAMALHSAIANHEVDHEDVAFVHSPQGLFSLKAKKKNAIKLIPLGQVAKHKGPGAPPKLAIQHAGSHWVITSWRQNTSFQGEDPGCLASPYWWAKPAAKAEEANLVHSYVLEDGIRIPCLTNSHHVAVHDQLLYSTEEPCASSSSQHQAKKKKTS